MFGPTSKTGLGLSFFCFFTAPNTPGNPLRRQEEAAAGWPVEVKPSSGLFLFLYSRPELLYTDLCEGVSLSSQCPAVCVCVCLFAPESVCVKGHVPDSACSYACVYDAEHKVDRAEDGRCTVLHDYQSFKQ